YRLEIQSVGVVFERQATGSHVDEDEPGYTVHRFGHDIAQELLSQACRTFDVRVARSESTSRRTAEVSEESPPPAISPDHEKAFDSFRSALGGPTSLRPKATTEDSPALVAHAETLGLGE